MGWNDRLLENPYEPYPDYTEQDRYEAWLNYVRECQAAGGLSSQNIDPASISSKPGMLSMLRRLIDSATGKQRGQEIPKSEKQESQCDSEKADAETPF